MANRTAFPRVGVKNIRTESHTPRGGPVAQLAPSKVEDLTTETMDRIFGKRDSLVYELEVMGLTEQGAKQTARAFVRAKNPFEPRVVEITDVDQYTTDEMVKVWEITARVPK